MGLSKSARELRRGAHMARVGGWRAGWRFAREEVLRNAWLRGSAPLVPARWLRVECNLCGWRGTRFLTHCAPGYLDLNVFCARCRSYPRHRGFAWLWSAGLAQRFERLRAHSGEKLVFAPEPGMLGLLEPVLGPITGVDLGLGNPLVARREDLVALSVRDGSLAFVSCFHVLEHVHDDRRALRELARALAPDGLLILCVPKTFGRAHTVDYGGPHPLLNGHCWDYGENFAQRLLEAGLAGESYRTDRLVPAALHARLALQPEEIYVLRRAAPGELARIEERRSLPRA